MFVQLSTFLLFVLRGGSNMYIIRSICARKVIMDIRMSVYLLLQLSPVQRLPRLTESRFPLSVTSTFPMHSLRTPQQTLKLPNHFVLPIAKEKRNEHDN